MDCDELEDPTHTDAALLAACRNVQECKLAPPELQQRWATLETGWRAHIQRHEQYTQSRLLRRDPPAARRVSERHAQLAAQFERLAIDLRLGNTCAELAAKIMLDKVIDHLTADMDCRFAAPKRKRSAS